MACGICCGNQRLSALVLLSTLYSIMATLASATVILVTNKSTLSFEDIPANFAPEVKANGISGRLCAAEPLDACSTLTNKVKPGGNSSSPFALIIRGGCSFEEKVRRAQHAGLEAVIGL
ncbi:Receptor y region, transmembrane domain- and RING domain-containing protein 2 [Ancistrocladus abbreviatus]